MVTREAEDYNRSVEAHEAWKRENGRRTAQRIEEGRILFEAMQRQFSGEAKQEAYSPPVGMRFIEGWKRLGQPFADGHRRR